MNKQLYNNIIKFSNSVGEYIGLEYESYHAEYVEKQKLLRLFDFLASYARHFTICCGTNQKQLLRTQNLERKYESSYKSPCGSLQCSN